MREFKKRKSKRDEYFAFVLRCFLVLVLMVVTFSLMRAAWGMYQKMITASRAQEESRAQLVKVETQRQGADTTLSHSTSQKGIEQQIRERYGVVRPGEGEIRIVRSSATTTEAVAPKESWWMRVFHTLFVW